MRLVLLLILMLPALVLAAWSAAAQERRVPTSPAEVAMRIAGALDLLALSIDMRLSGELTEGAARARIALHCKGRSELRMTIAQLGGQGSEGQDLKSALRTWRYPLTLEIEPLVGAEPATLGAAATPTPITGALVGECGLRPRPDGAGCQSRRAR